MIYQAGSLKARGCALLDGFSQYLGDSGSDQKDVFFSQRGGVRILASDISLHSKRNFLDDKTHYVEILQLFYVAI